MLKAINVRIYPNVEQSAGLSKLTGCYRKIYNLCLVFSEDKKEKTGKYATLSELSKYFHGILLKTEEFAYLGEHNTKVLKQAIRNLMTAYKRYFDWYKGGCKGRKVGLPRKKKKVNYAKAKFPLETIAKKTITGEKQNEINLTKSFRKLKFRCSKSDKKYIIKYQDRIKEVTTEKMCSGIFMASILIDSDGLPSEDRKNPIQDVSKVLGKKSSIDLGIKTYAVINNGDGFEKVENQKFFDKQQRKLRQTQRKLAKKDLINKKKKETKEFVPSNNREKLRKKIAKTHNKIRNQKSDFIHVLSKKLINENQVIIVEDLHIKGMMQNHKLAKQIAQLNLGEFVNILEYKAKWYNRVIIKVGRFFPSSKKCSSCGYIKHDLKLSDREWICPECGKHHDRDENATENLMDEGTRLYEEQIGKRCPESKLADCAPMDDKTNSNVRVLKSCHRVNQEDEKIDFL